MTREEVIKVLSSYDVNGVWADVDGKPYNAEEQAEAFDMAIEALKGAEINCVHCPRYFETEDETGVYSHCEDLISRADAIEAIEIVDWYHQNSNKDMIHGANDDEHQAWYKADDVYTALEAVPPADRPRGEWIHTPNGTDRDFVWWVCSECGHKIFSETIKDRIEFHAYCGRCGADMRSE